jgi:hypothetical protein
LRQNALRLLNAPEPDLPLLRATFQSLLAHMPQYRRIADVADLVETTATLANKLAQTEPALAEQAVDAVFGLRRGLAANADEAEFAIALGRMQAAHRALCDKAGELRGGDSTITREASAAEAQAPQRDSRSPTSAEDHARQRAAAGEKYRTLAGNADVAAVSYFERVGVVPPFFSGGPVQSGGEGVVTGVSLRNAGLAMATARTTETLGAPPLAHESTERLLGLARANKAAEFLSLATDLAFEPEVVLVDPNQPVLRYFLQDLTAAERQKLLAAVPVDRRARLSRILGELNTSEAQSERQSSNAKRQRELYMRDNRRAADDLALLKQTLTKDPNNLDAVLTTLGYGRAIDTWHATRTARLDAVLSRLSGDQLEGLVAAMSSDQRSAFHALLRSSDLTPQTRAKLAGGIVDDTLFFAQQDELVEALVTGMGAADLRLFFDQLYSDGKLEDFLSPSSFWSLLLSILTFGLARLFLHDNEAALRVAAAQGFSTDELLAEFDIELPFAARAARKAEEVLSNSALDAIPMDAGIRGGIRAVHGLIGNVKYYDFADLPAEAGHLLAEMSKGAGKQLVVRLLDIAEQGGTPEEIIADYKRFIEGLSPDAIQSQLGAGDMDGSAALISKALADGAVAGLIAVASDPRSKFITIDNLMNALRATNQLESPVRFEPGRADTRIEAQSYRGLIEKWEFAKLYTGFDYGNIELLYGGLASMAPAVAFGPTISLQPSWCPQKDGKITIGDSQQRVVAFHETTHTLQQLIYGASVNSFIDQGISINAFNDRNPAYDVTALRFDQATSIHDFKDHWEQQAELVEAGLDVIWDRHVATGSNDPAVMESYVPGVVISVGGRSIPLTPERWNKLIGFVKEFGASAQRALGKTGGRFEFAGIRPTY